LNFPHPGEKRYAAAQRDFEVQYDNLRGAGPATISGVLCRIAGCKWDRKQRRWSLEKPNPDDANLFVGNVLNQQVGNQATALYLNLSGQRIEVTHPRDLLDAIALKFLRSYRKVRICSREGCGKLFVYTHNNDHTCSPSCSEQVRAEKSAEYQRAYRKRQKAKTQTKAKKTRTK
jgi:hypothetical protein